MKSPFYRDVICTKIRGGKYTLWQARKTGFHACGSGSSAERAIADLAEQCRRRARAPLAYRLPG